MNPYFRKLLEDFADRIGLSGDDLVAMGEVVVDMTTVSLVHQPCGDHDRDGNGGDVVLFAVLAVPPIGDQLDLYQAALEANMLWTGTRGATLGLQAGSGAFTVCRREPLPGLTDAALVELVGNFADTAECWNDFVRARHTRGFEAARPSPLYLRA